MSWSRRASGYRSRAGRMKRPCPRNGRRSAPRRPPRSRAGPAGPRRCAPPTACSPGRSRPMTRLAPSSTRSPRRGCRLHLHQRRGPEGHEAGRQGERRPASRAMGRGPGEEPLAGCTTNSAKPCGARAMRFSVTATASSIRSAFAGCATRPVFMAPDGDHFARPPDSQPGGRADRPHRRAHARAERGSDRGAVPRARHRPSALRPCGGGSRRRAALTGQGGFDHNGNALRALMVIDSPYPRWNGAEPHLGDARRAGQAQWPDRDRAAMGAGRGRCGVSARPDALAVARGAGRCDRRRHRL